MKEFYQVKVKALWNHFKGEDRLFQLICLYLFFEYVRPQTIYPVIAVIPYSKILLVLMLVVLIVRRKLWMVPNMTNWVMVIFFFFVFLSSLFALDPSVSFSNFPDALIWLLVYFLVITAVDNEKRHFIFILSFLLWNFKMSQFSFRGWAARGFGYSHWGTGGGPGWFQNSGEFGIEMCVFFPLAFYFFLALKQYWPKWKKGLFFLFPFTALTGMISSSSRGAILGGVASLFLMLLKSRHKTIGIVVVVVVLGFGWFFVPDEQKMRFAAAGEDRTSITRMERWGKGIQMGNDFPLFGVGYENWAVADAKFFQSSGGEAHNIFIECFAELGYTGLLCFLALIFCTFIVNSKTRRIANTHLIDSRYIVYMSHGLDCALVGYLASGFFVTVFWYPYFWINMAMTVSLYNTAVLTVARLQDSREKKT